MLPGLTTASQCCTQVDQATPWAPASVGRGRGASAVVSVGLFALPTPMNRTMNGEVAANKLAGTPGSTWHYSNIGYTVLGLIAARAGGVDLAALFRTQIIDPLYMRSAR